jgi:3-hydroxyacyl-[acyl-carrier-protein] dehydratase
MPGVLIVEAIAQAAGLLALRSIGVVPNHNELFFFAGIDQARFKRVVEPGDQLTITVETVRARNELWKVKGTVMVDDQLACSATVMIVRGSTKDQTS